MKRIEKLKSSSLSRGLFAAKSALRMVPSFLSGEENPRELFTSLIGKSIEQFVNEVGELKGSLLKAAQILSLYGEYYLPAEINEVLKKVQSQGHFLGWDKISPLISDRLKTELDIIDTPIAAASIGQVHRATIRATNEKVVLKIQYPGIRKAIDMDIFMIKSLLGMGKILPKKMNMDGIYEEIRRVLIEEMDYISEAKKHAEYKALMENVPGIYVPKVYREFSDEKIVVSEYIDGESLSDLDFETLPQEERNQIAKTLFSLFFREIYRGNLIQTDSHAGNYLYYQKNVVLIDFGATLYYDETSLSRYRDLIRFVFLKDRKSFFSVLNSIATDVKINEDLLWEYCLLASGPLHSRDYNWATTTLPDDISPKAIELVKTSSISTPPHEFIFLDRKLLGLFSLLRKLKARFDVKAEVDEFLNV